MAIYENSDDVLNNNQFAKYYSKYPIFYPKYTKYNPKPNIILMAIYKNSDDVLSYRV